MPLPLPTRRPLPPLHTSHLSRLWGVRIPAGKVTRVLFIYLLNKQFNRLKYPFLMSALYFWIISNSLENFSIFVNILTIHIFNNCQILLYLGFKIVICGIYRNGQLQLAELFLSILDEAEKLATCDTCFPDKSVEPCSSRFAICSPRCVICFPRYVIWHNLHSSSEVGYTDSRNLLISV